LADRFLPGTIAWAAYNLVLWIALAVSSILWIPWMLAARKRRSNFPSRLGFGLDRIPAGAGEPSIWVHSVSVGETLAAAPFIRSLLADKPSARIILSTVTLTGQETANKTVGDAVSAVCYFPFDLSFVCSRFLDRIRPSVVVILETEIWPNFLAECGAREIPVVILNARLSEKSFRGYRRLSGLFRRVLANVCAIGAQSSGDAARFAELMGTGECISATGNMKYDMAIPKTDPELASIMNRVREKGGRWLVAGSTHEGEESAILSGFSRARESEKGLHLLLAPRHPERFEKVARLCVEAGLFPLRRTRIAEEGFPDGVSVLLLDTVGELSGAYAMADIAFVGGSLVPVGGHNILEPACFGVPVMTGTHMHNFREMAEMFRREDAAAFIEAPEAFGYGLVRLLADPDAASRMGQRGRSLMLANQGATARNVALVVGAVEHRWGARS
jgi:3-deoxy-D-manno-octulosonic-acid transferase